jgi:hypothetical protein
MTTSTPLFLRDARESATLSDDQIRELLQNWLTLNEFFKLTPNPHMTSGNLKRLLEVELDNGGRVQMVSKLLGRLTTVRRREEADQLRAVGVAIRQPGKRGRSRKVIRVN